jgi:diacylglycerol O-acyltransferase / wax synthase
MTTSDRLSPLDAAFLQVEDPENRMQLAGMLVFEGGPPSHAEFREAIADRVLSLPRFRQRLHLSPLGLTRARWTEDTAFDLDYHLSRVALPSPGGHDEIAAHIDQLTSAPLDLRRPVWEIGLVEGIQGGFGISLKVHHCMVDGLSIIDIFSAILAPDTPAPAPGSVRRPAARPAPSGSGGTSTGTSLLGRIRGASALVGQAPSSPFNRGPSGPTRRTAYTTVPMSALHDVRHPYGTTVNNVVLAVVAGALRRYLERNDAMVDKLHAFVPVNRRSDDHRGRLGNQIAMTYPALPVGEPDPEARLAQVVEAVTEAAAAGQAGTTAWLMGSLGLAPAPLARSLNRLIQFDAGMFNLTVTNVPGPPLPAYFLGRRLDTILGSTPLTRRHALTVAVLSYNGALTFSITTDPRRVPDGADLVQDIEDELALLRDVAHHHASRQGADHD